MSSRLIGVLGVDFTSAPGAKKPIVIDVREPREITESGTIPGALRIPMAKLDTQTADFPKNADLVFY